MAKNRRKLEGFLENFLSVLTSAVEDKGNVLSSEYHKGSCNTAIVFNKPTVKVIKTKVALYILNIISISLVFNHTNFL